jgi:NAD(P)-dependent dehydrogenase (short-subunit alcohol dehydrogenase family)/4'-phosphopantetheinyl transferase EntD
VAQAVKDRTQAMSTGNVLWVTVTSLGREFGAEGASTAGALGGIDLGIARCLAAEGEGRVVTRVIDLDPGSTDEEAAEIVARELAEAHAPVEVGYRDGRRFATHWVEASPQGERPRVLDRGAVVLAIGGARGITAVVCHELALRSAARFVVAGLAPPPVETDQAPPAFSTVRAALLHEATEHRRVAPAEIERQAWNDVWAAERGFNLWQLRALASEVLYRQCDLLDPDAVATLVREVHERFGRIDVVLQGGGALVEKSIADFDEAEFVAGMAPKALGTAHLLAALAGTDVGTFVNLSSISGRWGSPGQAPYSASHEVAALLTTAMNERRSGSWINLYFGPWLNLGMTRRGPIMERLHQRGMNFITEEAGANVLADEVAAGDGESIAFCGREVIDRTWWTPQPIGKPPLLDRVDRPEPGVAEGRRTFDPRRERLVAGHSVQDGQPILAGLVILEMIAQTASVLVDSSWSVTDVEDVVFPRVARFPRGDPREFVARVRIVETHADAAWLVGELVSTFVPLDISQPEEVVHASCRLRFGHRLPPPPPSLIVASAGLGSAPVGTEAIWDTRVLGSRRGLYANISSVLSSTRNAVVGEVFGEVEPRLGPSPRLDNPIRLDGQIMLGTLGCAAHRGCTSHFVAGIGSIRFFAQSEPSAPRLCRIRTLHLDDGKERSESEAIDAHGLVTERMAGIQKVRATPLVSVEHEKEVMPEPAWESLREHPTQREIRTLLDVDGGEIALANVSIPLVAHALETAPEQLRELLSTAELANLKGLAHPKRKREWLAGRIAAKSAIIALVGRDAPSHTQFEIQSSPEGSPRVVLPLDRGVSPSQFVSITHSGDLAAAVASLRPGFGIDVEPIRPSLADLTETYTSEDEVERLVSATALESTTALACLWATKEACRKASDPNRSAATEIVLEDVEARGRYLLASLRHALIGTWQCVTFVESDHAYAVARFFGTTPRTGGEG